MSSDAIIDDIYEELPLFEKIENDAIVKIYVRANHLPLLGIGLSVFLFGLGLI